MYYEMCTGGKIRGRLGRNNNQNVIEFENTMRRIWHHNSLKSCSTGNSIIQMDENEVPGGLLPLERPKRKCELFEYEFDATSYIDLSDVTSFEYNLFYSNCLVYIGGNVVKSIAPKVSCVSCLNALYETAADPLPDDIKKLIVRKDMGGLIYTSLSVYKVIQLADKLF